MSASTNDKITDTRNGARPVTTTVATNRSAGASTLVCASLTGWPTASKVHFVTYQIDTNSEVVSGTQLDCYGIVSGSSITSFTVVDGTDTGHSVGDVVEMLPTAAWGQDLADALSVSHERTGAIKAATITEAMQSLSDNTTNDVSTSKHGYVPKAPNNAAKYLDGTGAYSTPSSSSSPMTLLYANSSTDTNASATTVDSIAISGLTAKDTLFITYDVTSQTQQTAAVLVYETTAGAIVAYTNAGGSAITTGQLVSGNMTIRQNIRTNTVYDAIVSDGMIGEGGGQSAGNTPRINSYSGHTAWTSSWTLGLRHTGVTAGGSLIWSWSVYKVAGQ